MLSDNSESVDIAEAKALCFNMNFGSTLNYPGHQLQWSEGISNLSQQLTRTRFGTYSSGITYYSYAAPGTFVQDKSATYDRFDPTLINVGEVVNINSNFRADDAYCGIPSFPMYREVFDVPQTVGTNVLPANFSPSFTWLGVAQKELPGIRLKLKAGAPPAGSWYYSVTGGVLKIFNDDPTNPQSESFSGTLNQVSAQINSSSLSTWIDSRSSSFNRSGEQAGIIPAGANPLTYVFTGSDSSTMLKDTAPKQMVITCNEPGAPVNWQNSVRVSIYSRGEILPPRGIVQISGFARSNNTNNDVSFFINEYSASNPNIGTFGNTEEGALEFLTTEYHFPPGPRDITSGIVDPTDGFWGPRFVYEDFAEGDSNIKFGFQGTSLFFSYKRHLDSIKTTPGNYNYSKLYLRSQYRTSGSETLTNPYEDQIQIGSCPWVWFDYVEPSTGQQCSQIPGFGDGCPFGVTGPLANCYGQGLCGPSCLDVSWSSPVPGSCASSCTTPLGCEPSDCQSTQPLACGGSFLCGQAFVTWQVAGNLVVSYPPTLALDKTQTSLGLKFI